jgi:hypothetical protein
LSSLLWGFAYAGTENKAEYIRAADEKQYRKNRLGIDNSENRSALFSLRRISVLAKNIVTEDVGSEWASYFDVYRFLYPINS